VPVRRRARASPAMLRRPFANMRVAFSRHARMIFRLDPELENPGAVPWEFAGIVQRVRSPSS
jgi:hypothetical protein